MVIRDTLIGALKHSQMASGTDSKCRLVKNKYMGALICSGKDLISALLFVLICYVLVFHAGEKLLQVLKTSSYTLNLKGWIVDRQFK